MAEYDKAGGDVHQMFVSYKGDKNCRPKMLLRKWHSICVEVIDLSREASQQVYHIIFY